MTIVYFFSFVYNAAPSAISGQFVIADIGRQTALPSSILRYTCSEHLRRIF